MAHGTQLLRIDPVPSSEPDRYKKLTKPQLVAEDLNKLLNTAPKLLIDQRPNSAKLLSAHICESTVRTPTTAVGPSIVQGCTDDVFVGFQSHSVSPVAAPTVLTDSMFCSCWWPCSAHGHSSGSEH